MSFLPDQYIDLQEILEIRGQYNHRHNSIPINFHTFYKGNANL